MKRLYTSAMKMMGMRMGTMCMLCRAAFSDVLSMDPDRAATL